jgi:outer membrane protein OmpA-like peptidoglycan-associated protein
MKSGFRVAVVLAGLLLGQLACGGSPDHDQATVESPRTSLPISPDSVLGPTTSDEAGLPNWMLVPPLEDDSVDFGPTASATDDSLTVPPTTSEANVPQLPVVLSADALFETASADLTAMATSGLVQFAGSLPGGQLLISVVGYTDSRGNTSDNLALGHARAEAVAAVLRAELGDRATVTAASEGEAQAVGSTPEEMARDRRVEITVIASEATT